MVYLPNNRSCRGLKIVQNALECTMKWFYIVSQTFFMNLTMENPPWITVHLRLLLRNKLCTWYENKLPETFSVGQLSREIWNRCIAMVFALHWSSHSSAFASIHKRQSWLPITVPCSAHYLPGLVHCTLCEECVVNWVFTTVRKNKRIRKSNFDMFHLTACMTAYWITGIVIVLVRHWHISSWEKLLRSSQHLGLLLT